MTRMRVVRCRLAILMAELDQDPPLNQRRLAEQTGISPTTINQLYRNKVKRVDLDTIRTLCNYFQCEVGDLFVMKEVDD